MAKNINRLQLIRARTAESSCALAPRRERAISDRQYINKILSRLSADALKALGPLVRVVLPIRTPLGVREQPGAVFFLESGIASVVADVAGKVAVELGLIGSEGFVGLHVLYDDDVDPFQVMMQVDGAALRADAAQLTQAIAAHPDLQRILLRYSRAFTIQVGTTALANGRSKLDERLARWLLMVSDRVGTTFSITHEYISIMLAVRRPGVTLAIQALEGDGLIRAKRGSITILDRRGLIKLANGAYGIAEAHYDRLLA